MWIVQLHFALLRPCGQLDKVAFRFINKLFVVRIVHLSMGLFYKATLLFSFYKLKELIIYYLLDGQTFVPHCGREKYHAQNFDLFLLRLCQKMSLVSHSLKTQILSVFMHIRDKKSSVNCLININSEKDFTWKTSFY